MKQLALSFLFFIVLSSVPSSAYAISSETIETISTLVSSLMIIPMFLGLILIFKNFRARKGKNSPWRKLILFNTFIYSLLLVGSLIDDNFLGGFVAMSFFMLPTYVLLLFEISNYRPPKIPSVKDMVKENKIEESIIRKKIVDRARIQARLKRDRIRANARKKWK